MIFESVQLQRHIKIRSTLLSPKGNLSWASVPQEGAVSNSNTWGLYIHIHHTVRTIHLHYIAQVSESLPLSIINYKEGEPELYKPINYYIQLHLST